MYSIVYIICYIVYNSICYIYYSIYMYVLYVYCMYCILYISNIMWIWYYNIVLYDIVWLLNCIVCNCGSL